MANPGLSGCARRKRRPEEAYAAVLPKLHSIRLRTAARGLRTDWLFLDPRRRTSLPKRTVPRERRPRSPPMINARATALAGLLAAVTFCVGAVIPVRDGMAADKPTVTEEANKALLQMAQTLHDKAFSFKARTLR